MLHKLKISTPVVVISIWWLFWLLVSNLSLTGMNTPSIKTELLVILMLFFIFLGSQFNINIFKKFECDEKLSEKKSKLLIKISYYISVPIILFLLYRAINLIVEHGIGNLRVLSLTMPNSESVLFGEYGELYLLYHITVYPFIFFCFISCSWFYFNKKENILFGISIILFSIDSFIKLGRFNIYFMIVIFLTGFCLYRKNIKQAILLSLLLFVILSIGYFRGIDFKRQYTQSVIDYHTIGFLIFDSELNAPDSRLNKKIGYGRSTFGGIDQIFSLVIHRIGFPDYDPISQETGRLMHENIHLGNGKYYNAFYTIIYSLYLDGGITFIVIFSFIYGLLLSNFYRKLLTYNKFSDYIFFVILFFLGIFSIFQSHVESIWFWALIFISIYIKYDFKKMLNG